MIVEFTGCSGTGKSTAYRTCYEAILAAGHTVYSPFELFFGKKVKGLVCSERLQNLILDVVAFPWFLAGLRGYLPFLRFSARAIRRSKASLSTKFLIWRSLIRKLGIFTFSGKKRFSKAIILVDEGIVHSAHNILIIGDREPDEQEIDTFCRLVPRPDRLVCVRASLPAVLQRSKKRSDISLRLIKASEQERESFFRNAWQLFESLINKGFMKDELLIIENSKDENTPRDQWGHDFMDFLNVSDRDLKLQPVRGD